MLALRGKSQVGNMLHVVVGPETELFCDIHGAAILNVTPLLMEMDGTQPVFMTLTHCRSEQATSRSMTGAGVTHASSFGNAAEGETPQAVVGSETYGGAPAQGAKAPGKQPPPAHTQQGACEYCDQPSQLLPIPGFQICKVCAQIELGRLKQNTNKDQTDESKTT